MNTITTQLQFESYCKLAMISCVIMVPECEIKGVVQVSHGMRESINDYRRFMRFLCENGYVVAGNDHIGHGQSKITQGLGGFFGLRDGHKVLVNDVYKLSHILKLKYPNVPHILFGHSMGSFIARLVASTYSGAIDGLILSGTGGLPKGIRFGVPVANLISKIKGPTHYSKVLAKLSDGSFNRYFKKNNIHEGYDKAWLTRDTKILEEKQGGNFDQCKFTTRAYHDLYLLTLSCNYLQWYKNISKQMPILLFSGTHDPVGDFGKGVSEVYMKLEEAGVKNISLKLYPQGRHEMLNEINYEQVHQDILNWITINFNQ